MSRFLGVGLLAGAMLLAGGCASDPVIHSSYDRAADFASYRTFGFFDRLGTDASGYESLVTQALKAATRREMESRGYVYQASGGDLLVNFNASLTQQTRVTRSPAPIYYGYRFGYYSGWEDYETRVDQYSQGTLNIDVVDARRKRLVWEGVAIGHVTEKHRRNREAAIDAAVADIFARYPYRAAR